MWRSFRFLILTTLLFFAVSTSIAFGQNVEVPAELLAKALNHAASSPNTIKKSTLTDDADVIIQRLEDGNIDTLYAVASSMNAAGDHINSILIWQTLADGPANHILSMLQLGFSYAEEDKNEAVKYFVQAGEDGPHQGALYNAGRLFLELSDYSRSLAYLRAAATLANDKSTAMYAKPKMTQTATEAYQKVSDMLITNHVAALDLQDMVNIFPYASINDFPREGSKDYKLWDGAMQNLAEHMSGKSKGPTTLEKVREGLLELQKKSSSSGSIKEQNQNLMSKLQVVLLKSILTETLKMVREEL